MPVDATEAQKRAIAARGGDVCVSAGAGSGKTFVLVERFVGLVRDGIEPERILTITFTDKAASEMAERIGKALRKEGRERGIDGAWISTIHGFCARLLREKAIEAGVDPAFTVLTDVPAARVRRQALLEAQRLFRAERPGAYDGLVERVRWGRDQDGATSIRRRVLELYDELRAAGVSLAGGAATTDEPLDALWHEGVQLAFERLRQAGARFLQAATTARRSARLERQVLAVTQVIERLARVELDVFRAETYHDLQALAEAARGGGPLAGELDGLRAAARAAAGAYAEGPARALGRGLEDLLRRFDERFRALKAAQSALDFSDLEERTRELLEGRPDVRDEVQARFQAVLVDEFQDTSRLQQRIVDLVRRTPPAGDAPDPTYAGFFAVGDVKQSIYAFRHAEVRGLLDLEGQVRAQGGEVVALDVSFRTRPEVLAMVDEVFALAWSEPGSEVPHQPLRPGAPFGPPAGGRPVVELVVGRAETLERARALEARAVAARIATLIEGRLLVGTNPLRPDTFGKPLSYRHCAILIPATTALPAYERALRERGVPYRVASGRGFYAAREVVDAVGILKVAATAHDDLAMAAFLRSPVVGLSDTALMILAERRRAAERRGASLADVLAAVGEDDHDLSPLDLARALTARDLVRELRAARGRLSVRDLLALGLERSGLLDGALLRGGDLRGYANLQKLLVVVEDLEREGAVGPAEVAAVLEDLRASGAREPEANVSSEEEDAVSVLTVHAAKGLEWPLVVVADMGRNARPDADPVLWREGLGVLVDLRDPDRPDAAITSASMLRQVEENRARAREESKRLLYVAMTRAQDHLVLAGAQGSRAAGEWLAWARAPLAGAPGAHGPVEQDVAAGGVARLAFTRGGVPVRLLEVQDDVDGTPIRGPRGPAAGARPVLDAGLEALIGRGERPRLPGVPLAAAEQARALLARADAPALPPVDLGASVYTVTEVLTWRACPRRHLLEHVVGDRDPWSEEAAPGDWAPFLPEPDEVPPDVAGTLAHEVVAGLHGVRPLVGKLVQRLQALMLPRTASHAALVRAAERALELRAEYERTDLARRAARADEVHVERPFLVAIPGVSPGPDPVLLRGTVDLMFREGDRWTIVDHKAAEITALQVPARLEQPELQLRLYVLALAAAGRPPAEAHVLFLAPGIASRVDLDPGPLEEARGLLRDFVQARARLDLPPRPGGGCRTCPQRPSCPAGQAHLARPEPARHLPVAAAEASGSLWALTGV